MSQRAILSGDIPIASADPFISLSPRQNSRVVAWLLEHSDRPKVAVRVWAALLEFLDTNDPHTVLMREQVAEFAGVNASEVSRIMSDLGSIGAITTRRDISGGRRGPATVIYSVNPRIATFLTGEERERAQAAAPPLRI
jgi:hypothetical protein